MATKKQKRAAALAKHEEFMEKVRLSGLRAQAKDRKRRAEQAQRRKDDAERENKRMKRILAAHEIHSAGEDPDAIDLTREEVSDASQP